MKKETFCKIIRAINKIDNDKAILADSIEKVIDGYAIVTLGDEGVEDIVKALESEIGDNNDWISWWLYEDVEKVISYSDGRPDLTVKTPEQLYDFLVKE